jgi:hypothetical protein
VFKSKTDREQPKSAKRENLQKAQNKLLRVLQNAEIKDRIQISQMLNNQKMLSVNQTMAQIKKTKMWKATNTQVNLLKIKQQTATEGGRVTRSVTKTL